MTRHLNALLAAAPHTGLTLSPAVHLGIAFVVFAAGTGLALWTVFKNKLPRLRVWLFLIPGVVIAGWLGALEAAATDNALNGNHVWAFVAVAAAIFIAADLWHVAHPKVRLRGDGGGLGRGMGGGEGGSARSHRVFHSLVALVAPTVFLTAYGVVMVVAGQGTTAAADVAAMISGVS